MLKKKKKKKLRRKIQEAKWYLEELPPNLFTGNDEDVDYYWFL